MDWPGKKSLREVRNYCDVKSGDDALAIANSRALALSQGAIWITRSSGILIDGPVTLSVPITSALTILRMGAAIAVVPMA